MQFDKLDILIESVATKDEIQKVVGLLDAMLVCDNNKADFIEGDINNGVMAFLEYFLMVVKKDNSEKFLVERPQKFGGNIEYSDYEEIKKLPSADLREFAKKQRHTFVANMVVYQNEKEQYDAIHDALTKQDGKRAWKILQAISNAGGDDDEIDLIPLETTYGFE